VQRRTAIIAISAGIGIFALVSAVYLGTGWPFNRALHPTAGPSRLQTSQIFELEHHAYDGAVIPLVANQEYHFDGIIFTYMGSTTADASQCPPADLKPLNELYHGNEIKHFSAVLKKNGTKVSMDTCWPLPYIPLMIPQSKTGHGVSTGIQKRSEWRWFDPDSKTAGIPQDQVYFVPGNTTFYYFAERTGGNPNENPLPSGPSPRVTASIEGLFENNTYTLNSVVSFQTKVEGRYAGDDCGTLHLIVEGKRSGGDASYVQVSNWNETLPCSVKASAERGNSKANFEYIFPRNGGSYTVAPAFAGDYRITATVATGNNGIFSTYRTFSVTYDNS
jgi:hypothetical protein